MQTFHKLKSRDSRLACYLFFRFAIISFTLIFFFLPTAQARIIFENDFENFSSDWVCRDYAGGPLNHPTDWQIGGCGWTDNFGAEMRIGPGRNGSQGLEVWKKDTVPNGYRGELENWLSGDDLVREIHHSWAMKIPREFDKPMSQAGGAKLWRYIMNPNGVLSSPVIYLNFRGWTTLHDTNLWLSVYSASHHAFTMYPTANFHDNKWHSFQLRIKLNSNIKSYASSGITFDRDSKRIIDSNSGLSIFNEGESVCVWGENLAKSPQGCNYSITRVANDGSYIQLNEAIPTITTTRNFPSRVYIPKKDGIIQLWVDGQLVFSAFDIDFAFSDYDNFYRFGVGIGNVSEGEWYMKEWTSISFDDVVLSTEYVSEQDETPPVAPGNLKVR